MKSLLMLKSVAIVICFLLFDAVALPAQSPSAVEIGDPAPDFLATFPDGNPVLLSDLEDHVVLVYFWATWCVPCVADMPKLRGLIEEYQDRSFEILGVTTDPADIVAKFTAEHGIPWANHIDPRYTTWDLWGIQGLPVKFFIDRQGKVAARSEGPVSLEELRAKIDGLLSSP
jgi:peroxiredoxin